MAAPAKNILVVEDERVVARDIQRTLADLGYDVPTTAASAEHAIRIASERCPDLVLMDIRIKGEKDGIQTAELLRERFDVPVIYLTAYADTATVERAKATQPYGYLLKPVKSNELRSAVEVALYKHEVEKRLREREQWLSTTLRSIGDAVISTDAQGRVSYMNPVAEDLTGHRLEDVIGRSSDEVIDLVDEQLRTAVENPLRRALRESKIVHVAAALSHGEAGERVITDSTSPIIDERGGVLGAVMVFRDVSEEKRLERQLELADRLASIGTMTAGVAHEVNNPLAIVLANLSFSIDALRRHEDDAPWLDEALSALGEAQAGAERVRRIVADLTTFCRAEAVPAGTVDVRHVLDWTLDVVAPEIPRDRVIREYGEAPMVRGETTRLGQVFVNLLLNAARATSAEGPKGEIRVATRTDAEGRAVVEVRDEGCGMPREILKRVFEPFFTTRAVGEGMGLGLSISHGIIKALGGEIDIESREGHGTTVRVTLPRVDGAPAAVPTAAANSVGARGYILVIDDEPMVRTTLRRVLGADHAVTCPKTAREALALIDGGMRFDLILCDLLMPELDGMELHHELALRHPDQARRTVFLSGGAFTPKAMEFLRTVPNPRLEKPFEPSHLRKLVRDRVAELGPISRLENPHDTC